MRFEKKRTNEKRNIQISENVEESYLCNNTYRIIDINDSGVFKSESGLTDGSKCSVCDIIIKAQETIPALGHDFSATEWKCDGSTHWRPCSRCDARGEEAVHTYPQHNEKADYVCTICEYNNVAGAIEDTCKVFDDAAGKNPSEKLTALVNELKERVKTMKSLDKVLAAQEEAAKKASADVNTNTNTVSNSAQTSDPYIYAIMILSMLSLAGAVTIARTRKQQK